MKKQQNRPRNRVIIAKKQGDFRLLGWLYGRRLMERDLTGANKLEEWFLSYFPRVPSGHQRQRALHLWRQGFATGFSGMM